MKRFTLIVVIVFILVQSHYAQEKTTSCRFVPTVEVYGGFRFAALSKDQKTLAKPLLMYQTGILLGVEMNQKRGASFLNTGVLFDNYHYMWGNIQRIKTSFLDIPFLFGYRYRFNNKLSLSASAGLSFVYCYHYKNIDLGYEVVGKDMKEKFMVGMMACASGEYMFSDQFSLCVKVSTNFYFNQTLWIADDKFTQSVDVPVFINAGLGIKYRPRLCMKK